MSGIVAETNGHYEFQEKAAKRNLHYAFATEIIASAIPAYLSKKYCTRALSFILSGTNTEFITAFAEATFHSLFLLADAVQVPVLPFAIRSLANSSKSVIEIPVKGNSVVFDTDRYASGLKDLFFSTNTYYHPSRNCNLPYGDGFIVGDDNIVTVFQITLGKKHEVSLSAACNFFQAMNQFLPSASKFRSGGKYKFRLVYVVKDEEQAMKFKQQEFLSKEQENAKIWKDTAFSVPQFVTSLQGVKPFE